MSLAGGVISLSAAAVLAILGFRWRWSPESVNPDGWLARWVYWRLRALWGWSDDRGVLKVHQIRSYGAIILVFAACLAGLGIAELVWALTDQGF
jgi:hypothetical protein